jgi:hypothetical protein
VIIDEARSTELNEEMSAERAYELYWAGLLQDQDAFVCIGDGCTARILCACMYKAEQDIKVRPHFRKMPEEIHASTCEFSGKGESGGDGAGKDADKEIQRGKAPADVFDLSRPAGDLGIAPHPGTSSTGVRGISGSGGSKSRRDRSALYYRVSSVVQKYLALRKTGRHRTVSIAVGGSMLSYDELFRRIYHQDLAMVEGIAAIYWTTALIKRNREDTGYSLVVKSDFSSSDKAYVPRIEILDVTIETYRLGRLVRQRLKNLIDKGNSECVVFLWGSPWVGRKTSPLRVKFFADKLDHIDFRPMSILERIEDG